MLDKNADLTIVILKAFEQIGATEALSIVRWLADGHNTAAKNEQIRSAAQKCLIFLQQRMEEERERASLLRAAGTPDVIEASSKHLLKPAAGVTGLHSEHLLQTVPDTE